MLNRSSPTYWLLLCLLAAFMLSGCNGCRPSPLVKRNDKAPDIDELEKKKKEKEIPKEDFEFKPPPMVIPGDAEDSRSFVKPGHWVTTRHLIKANHFDFQADLYTSSTDSAGEVLEVEHTPFQLISSRPAALPKGQEKVFDTTYFIPVVKQTDDMMTRSVWLHRELRAARGGRLVKPDVRQGTVAMPLYQYFFLVLTNEPSRYGYLKSLNSFSSPTSSEVDTDKLSYYRVHAPKIDRFAPLPNHVLTWTSIAYLLWDDVGPQVLTLPQQQALLDWLHFGGQLIISGPNSLEKLRGSYLEPYLPAKPGATEEVSQTAIDELNEYWSLTETKTGKRRTLNVLPGKPLTAVRLTANEGSQPVPHTGNLVWERRVGSGRIVVSAFSLSDVRFLNWGSIDSFFNGALLRRPRRKFESRDLVPDTVFADFHPLLAKDSRMSSTLRFFSRDIGVFSANGRDMVPATPEEDYPGAAPPPTNTGSAFPAPRRWVPPEVANNKPTVNDLHPDVDDWHVQGHWSGWRTSMAAWNDRSGAANAARQSLKDAAGITIPKAEFVLKVLAAYLAILAPLNWLVFKLMGRIEWAWVSAPLIAIIGTFAVVRLAQLDIGFARSLTEVAIVESFSDYPRAHATRFSALYTSLSTSYDIEFEDDGSLAMPFAATDYVRGLHDSVYTVTMRRDKQLQMRGFLVPSNTTRTVHCEQMFDLTGSFALNGNDSNGWQVRNGTKFNLRKAGVLRKTQAGKVETAWLGDLRAKSMVPAKFVSAANNRPHFVEWDQSADTLSYDIQVQELLDRLDENKDGKIARREARSDPVLSEDFGRIDQSGAGASDNMWNRDEIIRWCRVSRAGEVSLGQLCELASKALRLLPGETRLIGWTEDELPGVTIHPKAIQEVRRTLFLVHLRPGDLPMPQRDENLLADVEEVKPDNEAEPLMPPTQPLPAAPPTSAPRPPTISPTQPQAAPPTSAPSKAPATTTPKSS